MAFDLIAKLRLKDEFSSKMRRATEESRRFKKATEDASGSTRTFRDASGRLRDEFGRFVKEGDRATTTATETVK